MAWTNSDYVNYDVGSATRLTKLRAFKVEILDAMQNAHVKLGDFEHDPTALQNALLASVDKDLAAEEAFLEADAGTTVFITRGRARRR